MPEDSNHSFMPRWMRQELAPLIEIDQTVNLPDEENMRQILSAVARDFRILGSNEADEIVKYAGSTMKSVELAVFLIYQIPYLGMHHTPDDNKLLFDSLLENGVPRSEVINTAMDIKQASAGIGLNEALVIYEALIPDPVAAHAGHTLIEEYINIYSDHKLTS